MHLFIKPELYDSSCYSYVNIYSLIQTSSCRPYDATAVEVAAMSLCASVCMCGLECLRVCLCVYAVCTVQVDRISHFAIRQNYY